MVSAISSPVNDVASPAASTEAMKARPPARTNRRRRDPVPLSTPTGSSRMLPTSSGTAASSPICR